MKYNYVILLSLLLAIGCKTEKSKTADETTTQASALQDNSSKEVKEDKEVFYYVSLIDGHEEYDESFQPIGLIDAYDYVPTAVKVIDTTRSANFVKINLKGKEVIVPAGHVLYPVKKHKTKTLSLWETNHYDKTVDTSYDILFLVDKKGEVHSILENPDEEMTEEPAHIYLINGKEGNDKIVSINEKNGELWFTVEREMNELFESNTYKIFEREGSWWADIYDTEEVIDGHSAGDNTLSDAADIEKN